MNGLTCPHCGAPETNESGDSLLIRAYKVFENGKWFSHCLVCAGYVTKTGELTGAKYETCTGGWF